MDALMRRVRSSAKIEFKTVLKFLFIVAIVLNLTGCGFGKIASNVEPLPYVESLPLPKLPAWIEQISPTGEAKELGQIRIRFKEALIPLESLESDKQKDILQKFAILPSLKGEFRFLTPKMIGFQPDKAIPTATRVRVTLKAGLADLKNHRLEKDLAWTFNTQTIKLTNLPGSKETPEQEIPPFDIKPKLQITSNAELNLDSLKKSIVLIPEGKQEGINVKVEPVEIEKKESDEQPQEEFNAAEKTLVYNFTPENTLEKATKYSFKISSGLLPLRGNLHSENIYNTEINTYANLAFKKLESYGQPNSGGTYGRFTEGSPQLTFNNGLIAESALKNITIQPKPKQSPLIRAYDDDNIVTFNPWALEPNTSYTITVGKELKDKFGQTLEQPITQTFTTKDLAADIWTPTGLNIFPAKQNLQLNISAVNLPDSQYQAVYRAIEPTDLVYYSDAYPSDTGGELLPPSNSWSNFSFESKQNQSIDLAIPLREKLGGKTGMLAYGIKAKTNSYEEDGKKQWREPTYSGLVQLTNLGIFAQWFPDSGLVRVHHLDDGAAVSNAKVEIYKSRIGAKVKSEPQACAIASTDRTGTLLITDDDWQNCLQQGTINFGEGPELLVIAREDKDWAYTRTFGFSGSYGYGVDTQWGDRKPTSRGLIFSDRQLYQPDESAWFTGVAYYLQNGKLQRSRNSFYQVNLQNPEGKVTDLGKHQTNKFGTFSLEVPLQKNSPLGNYSIRATSENGVEIAGEFRVAEFKPPNFKVDLNLNKKFVAVNEELEASLQSNYLFGAPVEGGKVKYYVTRSKDSFTPEGWEKFSFGRQWFWPEESPEVESNVQQGSQLLDKQGNNKQKIKVTDDFPFAMRYRVDAEVTDVSNLSVANSQNFIALPSDRLIGLQNDFVGDTNKPFSVQLIVTDPQGVAIAGEKIKLELQQMDYSSATEEIEGGLADRNQVEYKTVATTETRSQDKPVTVTLTPPESASYRIRANFEGAKDESSATDTQIWITGGDSVYWGDRYDNERLDVRLDKETYTPGETATALIQSPYSEAELYFAVVRDRILYNKVVKVKGGAPQIQFTVTPEMLPNAAVEAVLVRQGKPLGGNREHFGKLSASQGIGNREQPQPENIDKLAKIGFAAFKTNLDDKYLKVTATAASESLEPGSEQTIQLELKDAKNNPVEGQFTVMTVNESILQLNGYRPPDLVETVFAEQPITTRFADNRPDVVLEKMVSPLAKGWGFGGGLSSALANTRIRNDFRAIAYYNGSVLTDANGKATVNFKLPDDLTTWRVMVVATDGNWHFGNGETTFTATKPLLSNPVLPQFVRQGDRFEAGLAITNSTKETGNVSINGLLTTSDAIEFQDNDIILPKLKREGNFTREQTLTTSATSGTTAYRFPMVAKNTGETKVRFTTQMNNKTDAFEVPLQVKSLKITEQVVETGITKNRVSIPLNIAKNVLPNAGGLEISLASTLIPEITAPAKQLQEEEDLLLEPVSSRLAIASSLQRLGKQFKQDFSQFKPTETASIAIEQLKQLQRSDGGFASYPEAKQSDPFVSTYAAQSLAQAQVAFQNIGANDRFENVGTNGHSPLQNTSEMRSRLKTYLQKLLADPGKYDYCKSIECKTRIRLETSIALADLADKSNDFLSSIYENRNSLDRVAQIKLARHLFSFPEWQQEAKTLFNELQETVNESGRSATINLPEGRDWLNSKTTNQAETLRLFIAANIERRQKAEGRRQKEQFPWDSVDPAIEDRQICVSCFSEALPKEKVWRKDCGGGAYPTSEKFEGKIKPSAFCPLPSAFQGGSLGKEEQIDRLLQGLLNLRRNGTWGSSYDNAVALRELVRYSKLQSTPPNFTAIASLGSKQIANTQFEGYQKPSFYLNIPTKDLPTGKYDLNLQKSGQGTLHYLAAYNYALPGNQPGRLQGLRVTRLVRPAHGEQVLAKMSLVANDESLKVSPANVFDIDLELISDRQVNNVQITDYLPGGLEAVDTSFQTATNYFQPQADSWQIDYQKIHSDRITAYADRLDAGVYHLHYLARSVTPGNFLWPGAEAKLQYEPEQFGRCASSTLNVVSADKR
ncbi:MAG: Ig-like domain-containing protein [Xenococcaceae cyanobacterium]